MINSHMLYLLSYKALEVVGLEPTTCEGIDLQSTALFQFSHTSLKFFKFFFIIEVVGFEPTHVRIKI